MNRVYRSDKEILIDCISEKELKLYVDYRNKYVLSISQQNNLHSLFQFIETYFHDAKAKVELAQDKYCVKIEMPVEIEDESNYFQQEDESSLISIEDLKFKVEIKKFEENYIIEFVKRSGDRLRFYNVFQSFIDSLN